MVKSFLFNTLSSSTLKERLWPDGATSFRSLAPAPVGWLLFSRSYDRPPEAGGEVVLPLVNAWSMPSRNVKKTSTA